MHKDIPIFSTEEKDVTVCSVFNIGKTSAYMYIDIYEYFKSKESILKVLKYKKIPYHVLVTIFESRKEIYETKSIDKVSDMIDKAGETTRAQFKEMVDYVTSGVVQINSEETKTDVGIDTSISPEVDKITMTQLEKSASTIAIEHNIETIKNLDENKKYVNEKAKSLLENIQFVNQSILDILSKECLSQLIDPDVSASMKKQSKELTSLMSKLFS